MNYAEFTDVRISLESGTAILKEAHSYVKIPGAKSYTFIQISDCHFTASDENDDDKTVSFAEQQTAFWNGQSQFRASGDDGDFRVDVDTANKIVAARVNEIAADAVFFTGDVANILTKASFRKAQAHLATFVSPTYIFPGNHDFVPADYKDKELVAIAKETYGGDGHIKEIAFDGFDVIAFHAFFDVDGSVISFLEKRLQSDRPFIIIQHMPIYNGGMEKLTGPAFTDYYTIGKKEKHSENAVRFAELIKGASAKKIPAIFTGHAHCQIDHVVEDSDIPHYVSDTAFNGFYRVIHIN